MSVSFSPHWALPTLFVLFVGALLGTLLGSAVGCVAPVQGLDESAGAGEVCGGSVCFEPTDVSVRHWGDGEVALVAWRADDRSCEAPHLGGRAMAGTTLELSLHSRRAGARLPILTRERAAHADAPYATARVLRVGGGEERPLADEESVSGEATVLELDPASGRVRVRVRARWSSGVIGELLLDVPGPHPCPQHQPL